MLDEITNNPELDQVLYGLLEFCDQLPDAVILTDKEGKIISWNTAAEKLYGRTWNHMRHKSVEEIYEESEAYKMLLEDVQTKHPARENKTPCKRYAPRLYQYHRTL